ncbi:MAG: hypothetical protein ACOH2S_20585 [Janthinobacterium svalbardensis]
MTGRPARKSAAQLQAVCDKFNATHQVGVAVSVKLDNGEIRNTVTTGHAQVMGSHTAVIWLDGISGCYYLERVTPLKAATS